MNRELLEHEGRVDMFSFYCVYTKVGKSVYHIFINYFP